MSARVVGLLELRRAGEQRDVLRARLVEHELAQRLLGALERLGLRDLPGCERVEGVRLDLVEGRRHHEDRQEQRDADEHLVRRRGRRAQARADEAEDDEDAGEAGDREEERREQRQRADQQQQLDGVGAVDLHLITVRRAELLHEAVPPGLPSSLPNTSGRRLGHGRGGVRLVRDQPELPGLGRRVGADRGDAVLAGAHEDDLVAGAHQVQRAVGPERQRRERGQAGALGAVLLARADLLEDPGQAVDDADDDGEADDRADDAAAARAADGLGGLAGGAVDAQGRLLPVGGDGEGRGQQDAGEGERGHAERAGEICIPPRKGDPGSESAVSSADHAGA